MRSLRSQKQRTFLSALGIAVASMAIATLISIAIGVRGDVTRQIESLGVNLLIVLPGRFEPGQFNPNLGGQSFLKEEFARDVLQVPGVARVAPLTFAGGGIKFESKEAYPLIIATTSDWFQVRPVKLREGSIWKDPNLKEDVCVVGSVAAEELFGAKGTAVGKKVLINQHMYQVIGVTEDKKEETSMFSMFALQNVVYIPYHAAKARTPDLQTDRLMIQVRPDSEPKGLVKSVESVLGQKLNRQQFSVLTQEDLLGLVYKLMSILTWLVTGLTSIALVVGGVGIMTVMLMAVGERTKEIGIRKAVGARNRDIFQQFLSESVALSLIGGFAGLAISLAICSTLYRFTSVKPDLSLGVVALCMGVCLLVGTVFGISPALRAARLNPVEALRRE